MKPLIFHKKGQVVVEYLLLVAAMVAVMLPIMRLISERVGADCPSNSLLCTFSRTYTSEGMLGGSFRYFTLRGGRRR